MPPATSKQLTKYCHHANANWAQQWTTAGFSTSTWSQLLPQLLAMLKARALGSKASKRDSAAATAAAAATAVLTTPTPINIPCSVLHPQNSLCTVQVCSLAPQLECLAWPAAVVVVVVVADVDATDTVTTVVVVAVSIGCVAYCSTLQAAATWVDAFIRVFPTYLTLTTVPTVVLRLRQVCSTWQ